MSDLPRGLHVIIEMVVFQGRTSLVITIRVLRMIFGKWMDPQAEFSRRCAGHVWIICVLAFQSSCGWFEPPTVVITAEEF